MGFDLLVVAMIPHAGLVAYFLFLADKEQDVLPAHIVALCRMLLQVGAVMSHVVLQVLVSSFRRLYDTT
jgi:hypothetical protein